MAEIFTIEEAVNQGIDIAGTRPKSSFIVSSRSDKLSKKNSILYRNIKRLLNKNLNISNYSVNTIKHLTFVYIVMRDTGKGVDWKERKYYDKQEKEFNIEIKFPDYNKFITATKQEALEIIALETLRGVKKFLSDVKDFNYEMFYYDLESLFKEHKLIS